VWPENVEEAFMEALAKIPKLGRRKIVVDGKPSGRNELVAAYIERKTGKKRTRKQVSSHIQVLKNTRKDEQDIMDLLSDTTVDEGVTDTSFLEILGQSTVEYYGSRDSTPVSPSDSTTGDGIEWPNERSPDCSRSSHRRQVSIASMLNPEMNDNSLRSKRTQGSENDGGNGGGYHASTLSQTDAFFPHGYRASPPESSSASSSLAYVHQGGSAYPHIHSVQGRSTPHIYNSHTHPFWPCQYVLIQHLNTMLPPRTALKSKEIILLEDRRPFMDTLPSLSIHSVDHDRFQFVKELFTRKKCLFLLFKMDLRIQNLSDEYKLDTRNLFQSREAGTVECSTMVLSFGRAAMEVKETQTSEYREGRHMYSFKLVNEWLNTFLKTLNEGMGPTEVEAALHHLCIIQQFDSVNDSGTPLLVVVYEFGMGYGQLNGFRLTNNVALVMGPNNQQHQQQQQQQQQQHHHHHRTRANTWDNSGSTKFKIRTSFLDSNEQQQQQQQEHQYPQRHVVHPSQQHQSQQPHTDPPPSSSLYANYVDPGRDRWSFKRISLDSKERPPHAFYAKASSTTSSATTPLAVSATAVGEVDTDMSL
ncbi:hypothetical protein BG004_007887, partial [Podila humilis]